MFLSEGQNKKMKERVKKAWDKGDFWGLTLAGIDNFLDILSGAPPISFQSFVEYTGDSFDKYVLETMRKEQLAYVGGKMLFEFDKDAAAGSIRLSADLYFQTPEQKWIVKKKHGEVEISRFTDWDTDADADILRTEGKLELSIEPPEKEGK